MPTEVRSESFLQPLWEESPWPKGKRCAVLLTFDLDLDSAWRQRGVMEPITLSMAQFGTYVGVPNVLRLLDWFGLKTTFFTPGWVIENYPETMAAIIRNGHEIGHHNYLHEAPTKLTETEETEIIEKGCEIIQSLTGNRPKGYRSPYWEFSAQTVKLLHGAGFEYTSDRMDHLLPTFHEIEGSKTSFVDLPVHWVLDDGSHFFYHISARRPIYSCAQVLEIWKEEFNGIYANGGLYNLTMHPHAIGRPSRISMVKSLVEYIQTFHAVWFASPSEVAEHWRQTQT